VHLSASGLVVRTQRNGDVDGLTRHSGGYLHLQW
jgi:hypothetical protein